METLLINLAFTECFSCIFRRENEIFTNFFFFLDSEFGMSKYYKKGSVLFCTYF